MFETIFLYLNRDFYFLNDFPLPMPAPIAKTVVHPCNDACRVVADRTGRLQGDVSS